jgi:hypothetical protein
MVIGEAGGQLEPMRSATVRATLPLHFHYIQYSVALISDQMLHEIHIVEFDDEDHSTSTGCNQLYLLHPVLSVRAP